MENYLGFQSILKAYEITITNLNLIKIRICPKITKITAETYWQNRLQSRHGLLTQSDQIGRIFAMTDCLLVFLVFRNRPNFWLLLSIVKVVHQFWPKCFGLRFGRYCSQTHLVTLYISHRWRNPACELTGWTHRSKRFPLRTGCTWSAGPSLPDLHRRRNAPEKVFNRPVIYIYIMLTTARCGILFYVGSCIQTINV
jgi:hypothetical protein